MNTNSETTLRWDVVKSNLSSQRYRSRDSQTTTLYQIIDQYHERFEREWEARYQERYGYQRPVVTESFPKYLDCGIYERGCARAKCPNCNHSIIIAFSCKQRGLCPSCGAKRGVLFGEHLHKNVLLKVPHRHVVFTIPKRIRPFFLHGRSLNSILFQSAWRSLKGVHRKQSEQTSIHKFGAVMSRHTSGETLNYHPHIHTLFSDGVFDETDNLHPTIWDSKALTQEFQKRVMRKIIAKFPERQDLVDFYDRIKKQEHSGFNVWVGDPISGDDEDARMFMGRYLMRHPFSLSQIGVTNNKIVITSSKAEIDDWSGSPLDFLARLSLHMPNPNERIERCYGRYSCRVRGKLCQGRDSTAEEAGEEIGGGDVNSDKPRKSCATWARCIKMIYEVDPLKCEKCGGQMKIVAFIRDPNEIPRIMESLGLPLYRAPPQLPVELQPEMKLFYDEFSE